MRLGKLCKYADICTVYNNENKKIEKPLFLIKNVFCNRGEKGWVNCKRYNLYKAGKTVPDELTPAG